MTTTIDLDRVNVLVPRMEVAMGKATVHLEVLLPMSPDMAGEKAMLDVCAKSTFQRDLAAVVLKHLGGSA